MTCTGPTARLLIFAASGVRIVLARGVRFDLSNWNRTSVRSVIVARRGDSALLPAALPAVVIRLVIGSVIAAVLVLSAGWADSPGVAAVPAGPRLVGSDAGASDSGKLAIRGPPPGNTTSNVRVVDGGAGNFTHPRWSELSWIDWNGSFEA